ncbi:hypothetical protein EDD86DRAFT_207067 [Gorgonomyces haynaldii]|nr:hypothetical protein EDD86DRAFT_207067 [Gorgonomyces haynaldii]
MATIGEFDTLDSKFFELKTTSDYVWHILFLAVSFIGTVLTLLVIFSAIRKRCSNQMLLLLCLSWADLAYCLTATIYSTIHITTGQFPFGKYGCLVNALLIVCGAGMSILCLFAIAYDRFRCIILRKEPTTKEIWLWIALMFGFSVLLTFWPLVDGSYAQTYGVLAKKLKCNIACWNRHPQTLVQICLALIMIASSILGVLYMYFCILRFYFLQSKLSSSTKDMKSLSTDYYNGARSSAHTEKDDRASLERRLLIKCLSVTVAFMGCWAPFVVKAIIEVSSGHHIAEDWDGFITTMTVLNSTLNPLMLMIFDARVRANVIQLFSHYPMLGSKSESINFSQRNSLVH